MNVDGRRLVRIVVCDCDCDECFGGCRRVRGHKSRIVGSSVVVSRQSAVILRRKWGKKRRKEERRGKVEDTR